MKKVMISGGSSGLGRGLVDYLLERDYEVISFARRDAEVSKISEEYSDKWTHLSGIDVSNSEDLDKLKPYLLDCEGLINNVGMAYDGILSTQGLGSIENMININLTSVLYLTKLWLRARMSKGKKGSCVSISSIISERGFSGLSVYSATKGALNSMTKSLAREMGPMKFRFNAVLPGYFESELSKSLEESKRNQIIRRTPMGRLAKIEDILPTIEFLLTKESSFLTGQCIKIDGGLTV
ncbi:SDR family oxidoreductase [bacterium]|nr:SDR family oxidoreductase [bacterium]